MKYLSLLLVGLVLFGCKPKENSGEKVNTETAQSEPITIVNPLFEHGADPWIIKDGDVYHYCYAKGNGVAIKTAESIPALREAPEKVVWKAPENTEYSKEIWAPELAIIDGYYYIYVAADNGDNANHRMHVIKSTEKDINSDFEHMGQLKTQEDKWAIDGTVLDYKDQLYFIWSGWEGTENVAQHLYIAKMDSPTSISSARVKISSPDQEWEQRGSNGNLPTINEGPETIVNGDDLFIVYSASGSWSNFYCLGMLTLTGDDPMDAAAWTKSNGPVFEGADGVYSPGHASFTKVGDQDVIVYHTAREKGSGWDRKVKVQPFIWEDGKPNFGKPVQDGVEITLSE